MKRTDLAWAAGLFDGEGGISFRHTTAPVTVRLGMSHKESVDRFAEITGGRVLGPYRPSGGNPKHKSYWAVDFSGRVACQVLRKLYPFLTTKRQAACAAFLLEPTLRPRFGKRLTPEQKEDRSRILEIIRKEIP